MVTKARWTMHIVLISLSAAGASASDGDRYIAINSGQLFAKLGLADTRAPALTSAGIQHYLPKRIDCPLEVTSITIAVHPSEDDARDHVKRLRRFTVPSGAGVDDGNSPHLGDERYVWMYRGRWRNLALRRQNVTLFIGGMGSMEDAIEFARNADIAIQEDRDIAPRGQFAEPPRIISLGLSDGTLVADKMYEAAPSVTGLGPSDKTQIQVECGDTISKNEAGKLQVRCPPARVPNAEGKLVEQSGIVRVRAFAANSENLFVSREFDLNVVKEP